MFIIHLQKFLKIIRIDYKLFTFFEFIYILSMIFWKFVGNSAFLFSGQY